MRRACGTALALSLLLPASPAAAQGDTTAVAINTKDGFEVFRLAFQIRRATQDVVDTGNAAVAYASCTDCQTIALAIQVVLISGYDSSVVAPENLAIAINQDCSLCDTLASAYQFVITAEGNLRFTAEGRQALAEIRKALHDLKDGDLTGAEIQAKLDALMEQLADVLANELVVAGPPAPETASPSPSAVPPSSEPPVSPSVSPTAEPTSSPSPTESPSAEPTASGTP